MKLTGKRAVLAEAIQHRNEIAKQLAHAEEALAERIGERTHHYDAGKVRTGKKLDALASEHYRARGDVEELEEERRSVADMNNHDSLSIMRHYMGRYDKPADEVLGEARAKQDALAKDLARMEADRDRAAFAIAEKEQDLAKAKQSVDAAIRAIFDDEIVNFTAALRADMMGVLAKHGALRFISGHHEFRHRDLNQRSHPLSDTGTMLSLLEAIGCNSGIYEITKPLHDARQAGALPWQAAYENLTVDASALLPTDPQPEQRMKAAA